MGVFYGVRPDVDCRRCQFEKRISIFRNMKKNIAILSLLSIFLSSFGLNAQEKPLFRIRENGKVGYIDESGHVRIAPQFNEGFAFSDGLAAVRKGANYGFIDTKGSFVIAPQYDFANGFYHGIATVFKNGQPVFIDTSGKEIPVKFFVSLYALNKETAVVKTKSGKRALWSIENRKLITDTIFSSIVPSGNGVFVLGKTATETSDYEFAVMDSTANYLIPFGRFTRISPFVENTAIVHFLNSDGKESIGAIDLRGTLLFQRPEENHSYLKSDFHDGLAVISLHKNWIPEKPGIVSTSEKMYDGYIDLSGKIVFNDTIQQSLPDFSEGRTFLKSRNDKYILADRNFKQIGAEEFDDFQDEFRKGFAIVRKGEKWGIIDISGRFTAEPKFDVIHETGIFDRYFFYRDFSDESDNELFGLADVSGKILTKPILQQFSSGGFQNGLLEVIIDNRLAYLNADGKII